MAVFNNYTITLTFGDIAENHAGMQKIGNQNNNLGFTHQELLDAKNIFESKNYQCELIDLNQQIKDLKIEQAYVLIVRDGVSCILSDSNYDKDQLFLEQKNLDLDKKAFMYGRVVNKKARYNLCFGDFDQEPDYDNKKGRVIKFGDKIKITTYIKDNLPNYFGHKSNNLVCEGNYYYDTLN